MVRHRLKNLGRDSFALPFFEDLDNRIFTYAVMVSLVIHTVLLGILSYQNARYRKNNHKNIEIQYQAVPRVPKTPADPRDLKTVRQPDLAPKPKALISKEDIFSTFAPKLNKSAGKVDIPQSDISNLDMSRKQGLKIPVSDGKRQVSVPLLDSEKITNPKYLSYHDRIRNKIKNRAYLYVDNPAFEKGEVYLTFVVASSGEVTAIKLIEEKSQANDYLRGVGVHSVKDSSPFPPFPEDLKYPELTFNVVISFETGE